MFDNAYTVCIAHDIYHAAECHAVLEQFFSPYPKKMIMWYTQDENQQLVVKMLGSPHEVELAKSILKSRQLAELARDL